MAYGDVLWTLVTPAYLHRDRILNGLLRNIHRVSPDATITKEIYAEATDGFEDYMMLM